MKKEQIAAFCERYFIATGCQLIEKSPAHLQVKLSPEADRELTGRTYYWNFIERTGAEPETMSFTFIFDPEAHAGSKPEPARADSAGSHRYYGLPPIAPQPGRTLEEPLVYGARRLEQLFDSACRKGAYLQLFEQPPDLPPGSAVSVPYATWLVVNYKISYICDMKREELMSLGIHLATGEIATDFIGKLVNKRLSPRMPPRTTLTEAISLARAAELLEQVIIGHLNRQDTAWAEEARARLAEEQERIDAYYEDLLAGEGLEPETRQALEGQHDKRREEIRWQHEPRIEVCPVNSGLFHLLTDSFRGRGNFDGI